MASDGDSGNEMALRSMSSVQGRRCVWWWRRVRKVRRFSEDIAGVSSGEQFVSAWFSFL